MLRPTKVNGQSGLVGLAGFVGTYCLAAREEACVRSSWFERVERVSGGLCFWSWWVGVGWAWVMLEGLELVGSGWSVVVCAFRLGLVGRGLCLQVWHGWVGVGQWWFGLRGWWVGVGRLWFVHEGLGWVAVGQWWFVRVGLELAGWGWSVGLCASGFGVGGLRWSVVGCAFGFGVGGLGLVGPCVCLQVWHGWGGAAQ